MSERQAKYYCGPAYREQETPQEASSVWARLSYYPKTGKLQLNQLWRDRETGELRMGKTMTLDAEDLQLHPEVKALLSRFLEEVEN